MIRAEKDCALQPKDSADHTIHTVTTDNGTTRLTVHLQASHNIKRMLLRVRNYHIVHRRASCAH